MKLRKKILRPVWIFSIAIILLLIYAEVTQAERKKNNRIDAVSQNKDTANYEDSVQIGTPTSDSPWEEMNKLVKAYSDKNGVGYNGTMKLLDDNGENEKVIENDEFEFDLLGNEYYYKLGSIEVVNKKEFVIVVDNSDKSISISYRENQGDKKSFFDIVKFQKLMEERKANARVTELGSDKILTIDHIEDPQIQGYRIYYSPKTYRISKMLIGMSRTSALENDDNDNPVETGSSTTPEQDSVSTNDSTEVEEFDYYLEINYAQEKTLSSEKGSFHPENKFIRFVNNKAVLTEAYKDYHLSD
ncbi:MAG: hypothetical protein JSS98_17105 [Bacteroidetes bacterium]|nr:hypothetical protein [Bacteroidota bacterium]